MARATRSATPSATGVFDFKRLLHKRLAECVLICAIAVAVFLLVSLTSYHHADAAWSDTGRIGHRPLNLGGTVGAWLADVLLSVCGYTVFMLPFMLVSWAWLYCHMINEPSSFVSYERWLLVGLRAIGFVVAVLTACGLCALFLPLSSHLPFSAGGMLGNIVALSLSKQFGLMGAALGLVMGLLCAITVYSGLSWLWLADRVGRLVWQGCAWMVGVYAKLQMWLKNTAWPWIKAKEADGVRSAFSGMTKLAAPVDANHHQLAVAAALPDGAIGPHGMSEYALNHDVLPCAQQARDKRVKARKPRRHAVATDEAKPCLSLLDKAVKIQPEQLSHEHLESMSRSLETHLQDFGVSAQVVAAYPGPVVTRFELQLAAGTKVSKVTGLAKDLARSLSVIGVRVVEIIPGKSVIGLELPNHQRQTVRLSEILGSVQYAQASSPVTMALGKDIAGYPVVVDLAKMPHLLIAGTTGSGKSVGLNAILMSFLFKSTPAELRLILIDPKMLELAVYEGIPHLLTPVVTDMKEAASALRWCVAEMERRYRLMASFGVRNLAGFNQKINNARAAGEPLLDPFWKPDPMRLDEDEQATAPPLENLPVIMVMADEFADMMMIVGKKVEQLIARIAQKARAAGIHLILATQRPSVDVITGLIKANIPTRISFQVSSRIDSRTVLDQQGAEQLLGHGDMLYLAPGTGVPVRVHGAFVSDDEVKRVVADLKQHHGPDYLDEITREKVSDPYLDSMGLSEAEDDAERDALYDQAVAIVLETKRASISGIQRRLKIGYNRAARMVEAMEIAGLVSAMDSSGNREVLVSKEGGCA